MRPDAAVEIIRKLRSKGHEAYLVGGCVRDLVMRIEPSAFGEMLAQNRVTSTTAPCSTASVSAAISKYPSACDMLVMSPDAL